MSQQTTATYTSGKRILASELEINHYSETAFHTLASQPDSISLSPSIKTAFLCGQLLRIFAQQLSVSWSFLQAQNPQEILWHLESYRSLGSCSVFQKMGCNNEDMLIKEVYLKGRHFWGQDDDSKYRGREGTAWDFASNLASTSKLVRHPADFPWATMIPTPP